MDTSDGNAPEDRAGQPVERPGLLLSGPLSGGLAAARSAFASVTDQPAWQLTEPELTRAVREALSIRAMGDELLARLVADVEARGVPTVRGAASTRTWLTGEFGLGDADASRIVAQAGIHRAAAAQCELSDDDTDCALDRVIAPWSAGELDSERAVVIARLVESVSPAVPRGELRVVVEDLVAASRELSIRQLRQLCRHAAAVLDPAGAEASLGASLERDERAALMSSFLRSWRAGEGLVGFSGRLPEAQFAMLDRVLAALDAPRHRAAERARDHQALLEPPRGETEADAIGLDRGPSTEPTQSTTSEGSEGSEPSDGLEWPDWRDRATFEQRRGIALAQLLEHLPVDCLPEHGSASPTVVVTVGVDEITNEVGQALLDNDVAVSPGQVRRWACSGDLVPAVLDGESAVLDLGRERRLFDRRQRLALTVRDGGCIWPGCDRPASWCEAHHISPWSRGGGTDLDNGCLLCPFHHHLAHLPESPPDAERLLTARDKAGDEHSPRWYGRRYAPINTRVAPIGGWSVRLGADRRPEVVPPAQLDPERRPRRNSRFTHTRRMVRPGGRGGPPTGSSRREATGPTGAAGLTGSGQSPPSRT